MRHATLLIPLLVLAFLYGPPVRAGEVPVRGEVVDSDTGQPLPCRVYVRGEDGKWFFARSPSPEGSAIPYRKQNWVNEDSVEMHTTLSAHGFAAELPEGEYEITVARGKEYFPATRSVSVGSEPVRLRFELKRWIDMAELGWYSGDTHVHRSLEELPNVQLAEDLNVSFPLTCWVTDAYGSPAAEGRDVGCEPVVIDETHMMYPMNTEYEISSVEGRRHMLGAFFVLNHESVLEKGVPPVAPIARAAREQDALLELDKHNWPWSMMLVPVTDVDLYELANNHMWRTEFAFAKFGLPPADYMRVETDENGFTERGWIEYGLQNYYALLDCGFRLRPTAGTASGVHPVPLGFGRVYVRLPDGFDYDGWIEGLDSGRSFVTTGPMLRARLNGRHPGHVFREDDGAPSRYRLTGSVRSAHPLETIETVLNGRVIETIEPENTRTPAGAYRSAIDAEVEVTGSSWAAVRCFEGRPGGRVRFAHTGPWHVEVPGEPLRPRRQEIDFLIGRMKQQIERNEDVLPAEAVREYRRALAAYRRIAESLD